MKKEREKKRKISGMLQAMTPVVVDKGKQRWEPPLSSTTRVGSTQWYWGQGRACGQGLWAYTVLSWRASLEGQGTSPYDCRVISKQFLVSLGLTLTSLHLKIINMMSWSQSPDSFYHLALKPIHDPRRVSGINVMMFHILCSSVPFIMFSFWLEPLFGGIFAIVPRQDNMVKEHRFLSQIVWGMILPLPPGLAKHRINHFISLNSIFSLT